MKKSFLSLVALCAMTLNLQAQQSAKGAPVSDKVEEAAITTLLQSINDRIDAMMTHVTEMENTYSQNFPDKNGIITHGHEYVDLGIFGGYKYYWATCNIGAETPEDYGLYFAWGETKGYGQDVSDGHVFDWANYKWCEGTSTTITKYCYDEAHGAVDKKLILYPEDDAAVQNWGGSWRMPTHLEMYNLVYDICTWEWDPERGGYLGTSKNNGNTIFLPAAGYRTDSFLSRDGLVGYYWTSAVDNNDGNCAWAVNFDWNIDLHMDFYERSFGRPIRPVICVPVEN